MIVLDASLINKLFLPYESGRDQVKVMVQNHLLGLREAAKVYSDKFSYARIAEKTALLYREVIDSLYP